MKSFSGFRIAIYLQFLILLVETLLPMGAPLVEPAPPTSLTVLGYSYVKSLDFSFLFLLLQTTEHYC